MSELWAWIDTVPVDSIFYFAWAILWFCVLLYLCTRKPTMKWSSPLPCIVFERWDLSSEWSWGLYLQPGHRHLPSIELGLCLGRWEFLVRITWPERSKP